MFASPRVEMVQYNHMKGSAVMEELLKQLLEGQNKLFQEVSGLKEGQNQLINRMDRLENEVSTIKEEVSAIKSDMATKTQQDENTDYIKALLHRTEELYATFDGFLHNTVTKDALLALASKEDIRDLGAKFEVLNSRIFNQEAELFKLKAVK